MPFRVGIEYCGMSVWNNPERCKTCNRTINREQAILQQNHRPVRHFPLSLTSDGFFVCSDKFRKFAMENLFEGIGFVPLINRFYVLKVKRKIEYSQTKTVYQKQSGWCEDCGSFHESLIGQSRDPISKDEKPISPLELVESKLRIGTELLPSNIGWTSMHSDLIAGPKAASILREANFKGLYLKDQDVES